MKELEQLLDELKPMLDHLKHLPQIVELLDEQNNLLAQLIDDDEELEETARPQFLS